MLIIGELINASRQSIRSAIETQHKDYIQDIAREQYAAGADFIDVNAGVFPNKEGDYLKWLVETVQEVVDCPCALDSPTPSVLEAALAVHKGTAMINSISLEKERFEKLLPVVAGTDLKVIALCLSDAGMPETVDQRMAIADKLVNLLLQKGIAIENIHVDPLVQPVSVNDHFGVEFLGAVEKIRTVFEGVHTMCGLSNISFGLPNRQLLNQTLMSMAIAKGLDGAIINPLDKRMMATIITAEALSGRDSYCMKYLKAYRSGLFEKQIV